MTWLKTWRVAFSQGMRLPLCQILDVVWIGMGVRKAPSVAPSTGTYQGIATAGSMSRESIDWQEHGVTKYGTSVPLGTSELLA